MPCGDLNDLPPHHHHLHHHRQPHRQPKSAKASSTRLTFNDSCDQNQHQHLQKQVLNLNNLNQMMAAMPSPVVGAGGGGVQKSSPAPLHHDHPIHHHHLTVDVNLNHVMRPTHSAKSPTSPNPLDNANLRRQSTGLSAFNDYVVSGRGLTAQWLGGA
ncbi:hypothetical protein ElyMa_003817700 [Elysia marginata]|uniref:Uncharacterized protein n=1 Tax=Elysia marginata TaxID=1093978 RepID=A0AAV4FF01_9GAST|nr:hypothetical protein ElyMa_003817700 [Elysia marginata]